MFGWPTTAAAVILGAVALFQIGQRALRSQTPCPLPPGPPGLPWIGTVFGIDSEAPWKTYAEWAKRYGDIIYSRLLGHDIIIINSEKIAKDLLEKRSRNYSDRPYFVTVDMCGQMFNCGSLPYGDRWRLHRRFFHQAFRVNQVPRFLPAQHRRACHFLRRLLHDSEHLDEHVFEYTAAMVLNSVYNYEPSSRKDELLVMLARLLDITLPAFRFDIAVLAGAFPLFLRLPSWFPGMSFKKDMETASAFSKLYLEQPFKHSLQNAASGRVEPSMFNDAMCHARDQTVPEESWVEVLRDACGTAFLAASETSHSVLMTFFLMMVLNPEIQEKAHEQIDTVLGRERLPTADDRPLLPFLDAILWETLRYNPVTPLSVPHATVDDDVYCGFHIPKGALILTNLWSMAHDESRYPNPHTFMPERFLNKDGSLKPNDTEHIAFGFGRRICPGRYLADASVWNVIAKVLAVFKVLKPVNENGVEMPVEAKFSNGLAVHPLPFKCRLVARYPGMDDKKLDELIAASGA